MSVSTAADLGSIPLSCEGGWGGEGGEGGFFSGPSHTSDLNIGTLEATLSGTRRYRANTGTDWPGVSML